MEEMDFDEMRNQIAILKNKLDKQEIVSQKLLEGVMQTKVDKLKRKRLIQAICALYVMIVAPWTFHTIMGGSWTFVVITELFMMLCLAINYFVFKPVVGNDLMNGNVLDVTTTLLTFKRNYKRWIWTGAILLIVWISWLILETMHSDQYMTIGVIVGGIVGALAGWRVDRTTLKTADEMIEQMNQ